MAISVTNQKLNVENSDFLMYKAFWFCKVHNFTL